jgi:hypothetical protein
MNTNWIHTVQQSTGFRKYQLNVLTDASNHIAKCDPLISKGGISIYFPVAKL